MTAAPLSLKGRALQWLAQREHSRLELRRKLLRLARQRAAALAAATDAADAADALATHGAVRNPGAAELAAEVDALLDWLQVEHFLCDARFVESRVNVRSPRYGNLRIRQELSHYGAVLDAGTAELLKDSEFARARAIWLRKYGASASSIQERARQMRFLAGRGFSAEVIRRVVRGGGGADDDAG